jgi:hypothetical protein
MNPTASSWFRALAHCSGGDGPNQFDTIGALQQWVEKGKPPGQIIASRIRDGKTTARYGFCHFGYFLCSSSMGPPSLSEGILARQRILDCAKVGKGKRTVSDLGVGSYAQGAVAEAGVAVGCVSTSRRYSHASEKATQSGEDGEDRPHDPVPDSCASGCGIKLGHSPQFFLFFQRAGSQELHGNSKTYWQ